jgi:hypothetical protein
LTTREILMYERRYEGNEFVYYDIPTEIECWMNNISRYLHEESEIYWTFSLTPDELNWWMIFH